MNQGNTGEQKQNARADTKRVEGDAENGEDLASREKQHETNYRHSGNHGRSEFTPFLFRTSLRQAKKHRQSKKRG